MPAVPGFPASSGLATFQHIRRALAGLIVRDAAGTLRKGVLRTSDASLIVGKTTMAVDVGDFVAVLDRNGAVLVPNVGVTTVSISAAPSSGFRWSVIYVRQRESEAPFSDGADGPVIDKVESTTSLAAARALLPAGAMELGHVQVAPGTVGTNTAAITQTVLFTAAAGGVVALRNQAEQDAWTPADGSSAYRIDLKARLVYLAGVTTPGWYHAAGKPVLTNLTPGAFWQAAAGLGPARSEIQGGRVYLAGSFTNNQSVSVAAGTEYNVGTIADAAARPDVERYFASGTTSNATAGTIRIATDGGLWWRANAAATWGAGSLRIDFGGITFAVKGIV
ncbi:hypothetical protein ACFWWU_36555 [Streptomyces sp. NPDC058650]|uniref:hypothetical protein n=1 Tax=Streptomyces sp. NPDC058650 TaxID=3346575 RepID=UPI00365B54E5